MSYNKTHELKKWQIWKQQEELLLRKLGVEDNIIQQLREYDYQMFLTERRIRSRQTTTIDTFFLNTPYYDKHEVQTIEDLLDGIESESLFIQLSKTDSKTLTILLLKILGYSVSEISKIMCMNEAVIYSRIHRLKKKLKKFHG